MSIEKSNLGRRKLNKIILSIMAIFIVIVCVVTFMPSSGDNSKKTAATEVSGSKNTSLSYSDAKAVADKITVNSNVIKRVGDEKYYYWFDATNTSAEQFDVTVKINLIGSLDSSRGSYDSEDLRISANSQQAFRVATDSRPLVFGGDTQAYTYSIVVGGQTVKYESQKQLTSRSEDLGAYDSISN